MYNQNIKETFLDYIINDTGNDRKKISDITIDSYKRIFKSSEELEEKYGKDLYDFNIVEMENFLYSRKPQTLVVSRTYGKMVTKYLNWAIDNKFSKNSNNILDVQQDYFSKFVAINTEDKYLSIRNIHSVLDELVNYQDAVIVALLFNGIQGNKASEITNLTINDIDEVNQTITVRDDKTNKERIVDLKSDCLDTIHLIKMAHQEQEYDKKNGEIEYSPNVKPTAMLPLAEETPYIIKTAKTQGLHYGKKASHYTVYNRLEMIKSLEVFGDYLLTTKNIVRSGMIYEAYTLLKQEGGEIDRDKLDRICEKYNVKYSWALRDFLNMETIEKMYG